MGNKGKNQKKKSGLLSAFSLFEKEKPLEKYIPVIMLLRVLAVILTAIFALCLGIFAPLCIMLGIEDPEYAGDFSTKFWLISSILYTLGIFVLMLGNTKIAAVIHVVASAGTLVTFFRYMELFKGVPDNNAPVWLFMPCLAITALTIAITLFTNVPKWRKEKQRKQNEKAPSILGDK